MSKDKKQNLKIEGSSIVKPTKQTPPQSIFKNRSVNEKADEVVIVQEEVDVQDNSTEDGDGVHVYCSSLIEYVGTTIVMQMIMYNP